VATARTSSASLRKPSSRYHHGDLRRALIQEAVRAIASDAVQRLTLREIGKRLGVSRTALYRHFPDKATLLAAVAREGFERFRQDLVEAWLTAEGTRTGLDRMGHAYVRFAITHRAHYRVMFGDFRRLCAKDRELEDAGRAAFQTLLDALITLQRAGTVCRDDPQMQAMFVWAVVHGIAMLAIDGQFGPEPVSSTALEAQIQFVLNRLHTGIATPGACAKAKR